MRIILTKERELWHECLKWMPSDVQDIHFWPEMMYPYEVTEKGRGGLLIDEHDSGAMITPLLKQDGKFYHPFNFGGPISTPEYKGRLALKGPFYCTLNPFLVTKQQPLLPVIEYQKEAVWVDLTKPLKFRQTTRHAISKAANHNAQFITSNKEANLLYFSAMYDETMERNAAAEHWLFDIDWFRSFLSCLEGHADLCLVTINEEPECACILLHGYGTCYYHFAASTRRNPSVGASQFMVAKACEYARDVLKCKRLHLGGGVERHDGLFTFKSGFSDLTLPVYKYRPELLNEIEPCPSPS